MRPFDEFSKFGSRGEEDGNLFFSRRNEQENKELDDRRWSSRFLNAWESYENAWFLKRLNGNNHERRSSVDPIDKQEFSRRDLSEVSNFERNDQFEFEQLRKLACNIAQHRDDFASNLFAEGLNSLSNEEKHRSLSEDMSEQYKNAHTTDLDMTSLFRLESPPDSTTRIDGKAYIYFGGDGYLGLQADPEMIATTCNAALKYGLGAATSRRCYTSVPIQDVERRASLFFNVQKSFYSLNETSIGELLLRTISGTFDVALVDEGSAPFWRVCFERLNGSIDDDQTDRRKKNLISFAHCDPVDLYEKLRNNLQKKDRPLLLTHGVFANDGSLAPLDQYLTILRKYPNSSMILDDSHGIGVLGKSGHGTLEHFGFDWTKVNQTCQEPLLQEDEGNFWGETFGVGGEDLNLTDPSFPDGGYGYYHASDGVGSSKVGTVRLFMFASLAKAVGGFGCVVPGSELFVDKLIELNDDVCYSTPPNPIAAATAHGLYLLESSQKRRDSLRENVQYLRKGLRDIGINVLESPAPIVAFQIGSQQNMKRIRQQLEQERILVSYLPTNNNGARGLLRIAVFATHTREMLDSLLTSLENILIS